MSKGGERGLVWSENMPCLLLLVFLIQSWAVKAQQVYDRNIFILAGQSNMAGRGGVLNNTGTGIATWDGVVPPQSRPNPSVLKLDAHLTWVEAREPLDADIDSRKTNGVGPGMAFANSVLEKHPDFGLIGLVPCAIGGSNISEWERGKELYFQMIKRAKASLRDGGTIRALLWYQGETDTVNLHDAQSYQRRVHKFFLDVRDDLQSPLLPIIQVFLFFFIQTIIFVLKIFINHLLIIKLVGLVWFHLLLVVYIFSRPSSRNW